jgi:hypothetical protein
MMSNLECAISAKNESQVGNRGRLHNLTYNYPADKDIVERTCSQNQTKCLGIAVDTTSGTYGAFSGCSQIERSSWVLNQLYVGNGTKGETCQSLNGIIEQKRKPDPPHYRCDTALKQAGSIGTGIVSYTGQENVSSKGGLGTAGKAAIGIGTVVILLTIGGLLWFWRSKTRQTKTAARSLVNIDNWNKTELPDTSVRVEYVTPKEISGKERFEISGDVRLEAYASGIHEMPTVHNEPMELDGIPRVNRNGSIEKE